jgi:hypothetical protein
MRCRRGIGRNYLPTAYSLGARATIATAAIRIRLFMHGIIGIARGSCSRAIACFRAAKTRRRVACWLCCMTAMFVRQTALAQPYPYPSAALPQPAPPLFGSRSSIERTFLDSPKPVQTSTLQPGRIVESSDALIGAFGIDQPAVLIDDDPSTESTPADAFFGAQRNLSQERSAAPSLSNRSRSQTKYDTLLSQLGLPKAVNSASQSERPPQPTFAAPQSMVATTVSDSASRLADDSQKASSTNSKFAALWSQLSGSNLANSRGGMTGSKVDDSRKQRLAAVPTNNIEQAAEWSATDQTTPRQVPQNSVLWSGLARPFTVRTTEAPLRCPNASQIGSALASDEAKAEIPESERVPALLRPFYQTNNLPQNGETGGQLAESRARGLGQDLEHTIRASTLVRQLALPTDSDLRSQSFATLDASLSNTHDTIATSSHPEYPAGAGRRPMPVAYLEEPLPTPPAAAAEPNAINPPSNANSTDGEKALDDENSKNADGENKSNEGGAIAQQDQKNEKLATAEKLGEKPEDRSLEFLRAETVLLKPGKRQFDVGFLYTIQERNFPILFRSIDPANPIDDVHVQTTSNKALSYSIDEARFKSRQLEMPMQLRYGLLNHVQVFIGAPVGWSNTEVDLTRFDENRNDGGLGDIYWGSTIQFREAEADCPYVVGTGVVTAPSGGDPFTGVTGFAPTAPSLGNGFWRLAGSLLFIQPVEPVTFFYGAGIRGSFAHDYIGATFEPGMEFNYTFGMGFAINEKVTFSTQLFGEYQTELKVNGQPVDGTSQEPISLQFAATIARPCEHYVEPFVQFGVTQDAPSVNFGVTWTY